MFFALKAIESISFPLRGKVGMGVGLKRLHSVTHSKEFVRRKSHKLLAPEKPAVARRRPRATALYRLNR